MVKSEVLQLPQFEADRYCQSCRHRNPQGANFCEYCGVKLKYPSITPSLHHASEVKWKVITATLLLTIIVLASALYFYYSNYNQLRDEYNTLNSQYNDLEGHYNNLNNAYVALQSQYNELSTKYSQLNDEYAKLQSQYSNLNAEYDMITNQYTTLNQSYSNLCSEYVQLDIKSYLLNQSCNQLLEANNKLRDEINNFIGKVASVCNYYAYVLRYTNDMSIFVRDATQGCTSDDYFGSGLYQIHKNWVGMFQYDTNSHFNETYPLIVGVCWNYTLPTGQVYVKDAYIDTLEEPIYCTAPLIFRERRGVCFDFAVTLAALYDCYIDLSGKPYSVYCLRVVSPSDKNFAHECVLIKDNHGQVAIVDWNVITASGDRVTFTSIYEATRLHEKYWNLDLRYTEVFSRDLPTMNRMTFKNNDEFFAWVLGIPAPPLNMKP